MFTIKRRDELGYSTLTHFNEIMWLSTALAPVDDQRFHVRTIQVKADGMAMATDGHRMHIVEHCSLDEGFYRVEKRTRWSITLDKVEPSEYCDWPDTDEILAEGRCMDRKVTLDCDKEPEYEFTRLIRSMADNTVLYRFFEAVVDGMDAYEISFDRDCNHAIYFKSGNRQAIVMPRRM